jgi:hypothetical protein
LIYFPHTGWCTQSSTQQIGTGDTSVCVCAAHQGQIWGATSSFY